MWLIKVPTSQEAPTSTSGSSLHRRCDKMTKNSLESILNDLKKAKENVFLEFKKAGKNVPASIWETYSAFCNTVGGIIILGIEEKKEENLILGVENPDDIIKNIWNTLNNKIKWAIIL